MGRIKTRITAAGDIEEIHRVVVHRFKVYQMDEPSIYAAGPMYEWQHSEQGKFVMANAEDTPAWHKQMNMTTYGYDYAIVAELESKKLSEFYLKWGKPDENN